MADSIVPVPIADIIPGDNDRLAFNQDALQELADSIASIGLAQPITVRPMYHDGEPLGTFEIVAGERRFRACKLLGWSEIPAIVRALTDTEAAGIMLAENLQRVDISPLEAAKAFRKRIDQFGWSIAECAAHANVRPEMVSRRLKLLGLCPEAALLLEKANLPIGHAEVMAGLDSNRQMLALRLFQGSRAPSLAEFRAYCSQLAAEQSQESMFDLTEFALQAQEEATAAGMVKPTAGVQTHPGLPAPKPRRTAAETIEGYISDLAGMGHSGIALAVCNLYDALVAAGHTRVPTDRLLPPSLLAGYEPPQARPRKLYGLAARAAQRMAEVTA